MDADNIELLKQMDVIISCQGGPFTEKVYPQLRQQGWNGYWIDAASTLRMVDESEIILDPVNRDVINNALKNGVKTFAGGNCTVSLMLMGLGGLFQNNAIEWLTSMTYQSASGAGAKNMRELLLQMREIGSVAGSNLDNPSSAILDIDRLVTEKLRDGSLPVDNLVKIEYQDILQDTLADHSRVYPAEFFVIDYYRNLQEFSFELGRICYHIVPVSYFLPLTTLELKQ